MRFPTVSALAADLSAGRTTSRRLVEQSLQRIGDPKGEGARVFTKVYADAALAVRRWYFPHQLHSLPVTSSEAVLLPLFPLDWSLPLGSSVELQLGTSGLVVSF